MKLTKQQELDEFKEDYSSFKALADSITKQIARINAKLEGAEEWPKEGDEYWCVTASGVLLNHAWENDARDREARSMGNVFKTEAEAELHKLRLQSMAQRWRPGDGGRYWYAQREGRFERAATFDPQLYVVDKTNYWIGNCHPTEAAAREWYSKFGKAFEVPES